jgi:hypothetical protein
MAILGATIQERFMQDFLKWAAAAALSVSAGVGTAAAADVEVPYSPPPPRYSQPQPPPPDYYPEPPRNYGFREVPPPNYAYREPPPAYSYEEEEVLPPAYVYPPRPFYRYYRPPVVGVVPPVVDPYFRYRRNYAYRLHDSYRPYGPRIAREPYAVPRRYRNW